MLQVQFLREERVTVLKGLEKRNFSPISLVDDAIAADDSRKKLQFELEENLAKMKTLSNEIGGLMKAGKKEEAETAKISTTKYKEDIENLKEELKKVEANLQDILYTIPNIPFEKVMTNMDKYANTSGGTIPIVLDETYKSGKIQPGNLLLFAAVGSGWTWGTALYKA